MFIPKLHFAVDERLNLWLQQCCRAQEVNDTNLNLVNFASIIEDIQLNKFVCDLPPSIKKLERELELDTDSTNEKRKKKKKVVKQVKNQDPNPAWKCRIDENWDTVFKNKTKDGPTLSFGSKGCFIKYHGKLICYDDCRWKDSHCTLIEEDEKKLDKFIKELRGE